MAETQANDNGYTCMTCKQWVPFGTTHTCSQWQPWRQQVSVSPPPQDPALLRIATALERIAAALEGK